MTNVCELATRRKADLVTTAKYELASGGAHEKLLGPSKPRPSTRTAAPSSRLGAEVKARIDKVLGRSLHIREVDAGSCNGCEVEIVGPEQPGV